MKKVYALLAVLLISLPISAALAMPIIPVAVVTAVVSFSMPSITGVAMAGLNKEIWIDELLEGFYADDSFLSEMRDMSAFVDNNTINLAEAGVNPDVLINNTSYPIAVSQRSDAPLALPLDTYDTENTLVRAIEMAELAHDKVASIVFGHKQSLRMTFMEYAAFRIAPATDTAFTPKMVTTGTANSAGNKRIKFDDILELQRRFDEQEISEEGRILVLTATHRSELQAEDRVLYNQMLKDKELYGFKLYKLASKRLPRYNKTTGAKVAWQAAAAPSTDVVASIAFHKDEVMKARGTVEVFSKLKDPLERGDVLGYQMRGLSMPIRGKGIAAIYSPAA
jgi:hypothetical protein